MSHHEYTQSSKSTKTSAWDRLMQRTKETRSGVSLALTLAIGSTTLAACSSAESQPVETEQSQSDITNGEETPEETNPSPDHNPETNETNRGDEDSSSEVGNFDYDSPIEYIDGIAIENYSTSLERYPTPESFADNIVDDLYGRYFAGGYPEDEDTLYDYVMDPDDKWKVFIPGDGYDADAVLALPASQVRARAFTQGVFNKELPQIEKDNPELARMVSRIIDNSTTAIAAFERYRQTEWVSQSAQVDDATKEILRNNPQFEVEWYTVNSEITNENEGEYTARITRNSHQNLDEIYIYKDGRGLITLMDWVVKDPSTPNYHEIIKFHEESGEWVVTDIVQDGESPR